MAGSTGCPFWSSSPTQQQAKILRLLVDHHFKFKKVAALFYSSAGTTRAVFQVHSDDDGVTRAAEAVTFPMLAGWMVCVGPPGGIQLRSGRQIVTGYFSRMSGGRLLARCFILFNDDSTWASANSWTLGALSSSDDFCDENQAAESWNGTLFLAVRGNASWRQFAYSCDQGETMTRPVALPIPEPPGGCEGSLVTIMNSLLNGTVVLYSGIADPVARDHLTLWASNDDGANWLNLQTIDVGSSAYSSMVVPLVGAMVDIVYEKDNYRLVVHTTLKPF